MNIYSKNNMDFMHSVLQIYFWGYFAYKTFNIAKRKGNSGV